MNVCRDKNCKQHQRYLLQACSSDPFILALWFVDPNHEISGVGKTNEADAAFEHMEACVSCTEWFYKTVPREALKRQARMLRYCCSGMFVAVEEPDRYSRNQFTYSLFRGEDVCWRIDGKQTFANYCPWCGLKLPDKPFIDSQDWPNNSFKPTPLRGAA